MSSIRSIYPQDPHRSTVSEELDAMDWQHRELARLLSEIERSPHPSFREDQINEARRRLNTLVQRVFRAKQIARGLRVPKAT